MRVCVRARLHVYIVSFQVLNTMFNNSITEFAFLINVIPGDSLALPGWHSGIKFASPDRDEPLNQCASMYGGSWWYSGCFKSKLTGSYLKPGHYQFGKGIHWQAWHPSSSISLKRAEMKMKLIRTGRIRQLLAPTCKAKIAYIRMRHADAICGNTVRFSYGLLLVSVLQPAFLKRCISWTSPFIGAYKHCKKYMDFLYKKYWYM